MNGCPVRRVRSQLMSFLFFARERAFCNVLFMNNWVGQGKR